METLNRLSEDHSMYEARLRAQHLMVLGLGVAPLGVIVGLLLGVPIAQRIAGFPMSIVTTGVLSVVALLGLGLLGLAGSQGAAQTMQGFWNLEHALSEVSEERRIAWGIALAGLFFMGFGFGYTLALLLF